MAYGSVEREIVAKLRLTKFVNDCHPVVGTVYVPDDAATDEDHRTPRDVEGRLMILRLKSVSKE